MELSFHFVPLQLVDLAPEYPSTIHTADQVAVDTSVSMADLAKGEMDAVDLGRTRAYFR